MNHIACKLQIAFGILFISTLLSAQNQYSAKVIQPAPIATPSICLVSVTNDNKNIIVWEKPVEDYIAYFKIYRESTKQTNQWDSIGYVLYEESSVYTDSTSEPQKQSSRYKISSVDRCSNETDLSSLHKTINVSILKSVNNTYSLIWDEYEGFAVSSYKIYRGTTPNDLKLIGSATAGNFNYNDSYSPVDAIYYQIEVVSPNNCILSKKKATSFNSSRSNIVSNIATGINTLTAGADVMVYPNPFNKKTTISFPNNNNSKYVLTLLSLSGKTVLSRTVQSNKVELEKEQLTEGMFIIVLKGQKTFQGKLSITK